MNIYYSMDLHGFYRDEPIVEASLASQDGFQIFYKYYGSDKKPVAEGIEKFLSSYDNCQMIGEDTHFSWNYFYSIWGKTILSMPSKINHIPVDLSSIFFAKGYSPNMKAEDFIETEETKGNKARIIKLAFEKLMR